MALAFFLVIRLLGCQLWSTSGFSPVGSGIAGSEQGDERRHMGSGLGWAGAYRAPGWYHLDTLGFSGLMTSLAVPFTVSLLGRVIFGGCMAFAVGRFPLFPFCMRNCNCCLQISVGRFLPWGFLWKTDTLLYIHHWYYLRRGKKRMCVWWRTSINSIF